MLLYDIEVYNWTIYSIMKILKVNLSLQPESKKSKIFNSQCAAQSRKSKFFPIQKPFILLSYL